MTFRFSVIRTWLVGVLLLVAAGVRPAAAATVYLGPNEANRTLQQAFAAMRGGDTLIIRDGVYAERFINPPSGTAGAYTTIKAEHVGGVLFDGAGLADWSSTLTLYNVSYLQIEGLHFKANPDNPTVTVAAVSGGAHHIKLLRCAFYDAAKTENNSVVNIGPAATDVLLEECWAWGYGRYKFLIYQAQRVVVRRSVARHDYHTPYPDFGGQSATFTMYDSTDVLFENNIVVDSGLSDGSNGTFWGGIWSENNSAVDNRGTYLGNIFLNLEGLAAINDPKLNTGARVITNNVIWDAEGGYDGDVQGGSPTLTIDHSTFGNIWGTYSRDAGKAWGTAASYGWTAALTGALTKNSLIYDMHSYGVTAWMRSDYNNFYGNGTNYAAGVYGIPAPTPGAHDRYADPGQKYITRIEAESPLKGAASDGGDIGANVLYRYGVSGTLWGEAGYDQLTTEALWPFPNEALIKADMASYGGPGPAGTRGFCANGQTLTNYIWGYLGHSVPPFGLLATPGDRSVTLSWYRPADLALATTTGFNIYWLVAGQYALVGTVAGNATYTATISGLTPAEPYVFAVATVDAQKGESGLSDPATATPSSGSGLTTPTITWPTPAAIVQGTALSATQLNATASVAGAFVYTPAAGTVLAAGTWTLTATFTPTNTTVYTTATASRSLVVAAAAGRTTPTITWPAPASIVQGTALSATQLNATASVAGAFVYTPPAGTVLAVGTQTLAVTFTPTNTTLYTTASASRTLVVTAATTAVRLLEDLLGRQVFPVDNWWNLDISQAPVDPQSAAFITFLGATRGLHPDFGPPPYGIPYVTVGASQPRVPVTFTLYGDESDAGAPGDPPGYPVPTEARTLPNYIEGGVAGGGTAGDRHMLIVDRDRELLYELGGAVWNTAANRWDAAAGAVFDLASNARRPDGWTSVDAAGLAVLPGLIRYDEAYGTGEIRHALRFTSRATNGYVWPASHRGGSTAGAPPLGTRLRLKASVDLSGFAPPQRRIFQAMKTYGLILADNGSDLYINGTMDGRWNNDDLNPAFSQLKGGDFEVVQLGWRPTTTPTTPTITWATPASIVQGTALSAIQLNATASVAGAFVYTPPAGTVLAVGTQTLAVTFTPTDTTLYTTASASRSLVVTAPGRTTPTITWPTPASIVQGTALSATQLNATASVAGAFVYTPAAGTVLAAGTWTLTATFTPTNTTLYTTASASRSLVVTAAGGSPPNGPPYQLTVTRPTGGMVNGAGLACGTTAASCQVTMPAAMSLGVQATPDVGYTFVGWTGDCVGTAPGYLLELAGPRTCGAMFSLAGRVTPTITWATPASIVQGTALSALQLNAAASVAGSFVYTPAAGTVLPVGTKTLAVTFTPANTTLYTTATASRSLVVTAAGGAPPNGPPYRLTVTRPTGGMVNGAGVACGTTAAGCQVTMPAAMSLGVEATPDVGYTFAGWTGDCVGTVPGYLLELAGPRTCGAVFNLARAATATVPVTIPRSTGGPSLSDPPYSLAVSRPTGGMIRSAGISCGTTGMLCQVTIPAAISLRLQATPDPGYVLAGWVGDCVGTSPSLVLPLNKPRTCGAVFTTTHNAGNW